MPARWIWFALSVVCVVSACKTTRPDSTLDYGHTRDAASAEDAGFGRTLLATPPEATVCVYAELLGEETKRAILEWAAAISRADHLTVVVFRAKGKFDVPVADRAAAGCLSRLSAAVIVKDERHAATERLRSDAVEDQFGPQCFRGVIAYKRFNDLHICRNDPQTYGVILHEVGHLWGLCDMYQIEGHANNCDPANSTGYTDQAIMASPDFGRLMPDDKAGIVALSRRDTPVNAIWKSYLAGDRQPLKQYIAKYDEHPADAPTTPLDLGEALVTLLSAHHTGVVDFAPMRALLNQHSLMTSSFVQQNAASTAILTEQPTAGGWVYAGLARGATTTRFDSFLNVYDEGFGLGRIAYVTFSPGTSDKTVQHSFFGVSATSDCDTGAPTLLAALGFTPENVAKHENEAVAGYTYWLGLSGSRSNVVSARVTCNAGKVFALNVYKTNTGEVN